MKRQIGFAIPSLLEVIGVILALVALVWATHALVGGVTYWIERRDAAIDKAGYNRAAKEYDARDLERAANDAKEIARLTKLVQTQQKDNAAKVASLNDQLKKAKDNGKNAETILLADLAAGSNILRDGVIEIARCPVETTGAATSVPATNAAGSKGSPCYRLSRSVEAALVEIAGRADRYAQQVMSCVALREEDILLINR